ncbi:ATP-binding cassette subfamily C protein [Parvularcula dongshanensis]|uniref:ATP-binding cassette subfamily C protein n=1 Tax=Parvularcula dongshanensis TaxID=1173995 RepID=A0A840I4J0_9PROT|nr:ATP-binding cassette subfamily C protein [Parvularcula dongshanensis]
MAKRSARASVQSAQVGPAEEQEEGGFLAYFARAYPLRTALMIALLILAGLAEGVGLVALLPLVGLVLPNAGGGSSEAPPGATERFFETLGIEPTLGLILTLIVLLMTLRAIAMWLAMRQVGFTAAMVSTRLRQRLIKALTEADWRHFSRQPTGHLTAAVSDQANRSAGAYADSCACAAEAIQGIIYLAVVLVISPLAALLAVVSGAFMAFVFGPFVRRTRNAGKRQAIVMRTIISRLTEVLAAIKPVKAMGQETEVWPLLEHETRAFEETQRQAIVARESAAAFWDPIATLIIAIGLYLALTKTSVPLTELVVLAVVFYRLITKASQVQRRYQAAVLNGHSFGMLMTAVHAAERAREPRVHAGRVPQLGDGITLRGVAVTYGEHQVLSGIDLTIPAGRMTAITGPSGSGKTTLMDVITGLSPVSAGMVSIGGTPLGEVDMGAWRRSIGYVPQEVLLFFDTIRANVALAGTATDEEVEAALKAAGAWSFVRELPGGLDYVVGERGTRISGGQRQRIAIARALVRRPKLLILDEATAGLDTATEAAVLETVLALRPGVTIIAVSHQPAVPAVADRIIEVGGGSARVVSS